MPAMRKRMPTREAEEPEPETQPTRAGPGQGATLRPAAAEPLPSTGGSFLPSGGYVVGLQRAAGNATVAAALQLRNEQLPARAVTPAPAVAVQRQEAPGSALPADVNVGFNPMDRAHRLAEAIDQSDVEVKMGQDPRSWTRHIDFAKTVSQLSHLTADQVKLVDAEYVKLEKRPLREDIFGGGESHYRSDLSKDQLDQIDAMLGGTAAATRDAAQEAAAHQLTVDAARLHELLYGNLKEKDVEEVMVLLRRSPQANADLRAEYERLHVTTFSNDLGKLPILEIARATLLVTGQTVAADRYKVSLELSRIQGIDQEITEITKPKDTLTKFTLALSAYTYQKYMLDEHVKDLRKERQRLVEDITRRGQQAVLEGRREVGGDDPMAAQMAGEARASAVLGGVDSAATTVGGREGEILRAVAFSDPAARAAAELRKLKESDDLKPASIAGALRGLRDEAEAEAKRRHPQGTEEDIAVETRTLSDQYFQRLRDVWNAGVTGDGPNFDQLLQATGNDTEVNINKQLMSGQGRMDDVSELVFALSGSRKDMEAVKRVLYDKSATEIADLETKYMIATGGRSLHYDLFGEGATHADEQEKDFWTGPMAGYGRKFGGKASGSDRLLLEDYMQRPKHEGACEEVLYLAARAEREYQYTIDNRGATGWWRDNWGNEARSLLDATIKTVRERKDEYLQKAGWVYKPFGEDSVMNPEWTGTAEAHEILHQLRLARATIRGDRAGYEKATAALRAIFEMVAAFAIQAALTAVIGPVAEALFALEAVEAAEAAATTIRLANWARETGVGIAATVGSNAIVYGDDYSWDMFKHDVLGGFGGAIGQAAGEKLMGPIAKSFSERLGAKCPPEIVKIAGTYGNITGAALATDEDVDLSMQNVVKTHMMAKGGELITKGVKSVTGLEHGAGGAGRERVGEQGGPEPEKAAPGAREEPVAATGGGAGRGEPTVPMALPEPGARVGGPPVAVPGEPSVSMHLPEPGEVAPKVPEKAAPKAEPAPSPEAPPAPGQGERGPWVSPSLADTYADRKFPRLNVRIERGLVGFDMQAVMRELEATPWGSRIADRIRAGEVQVRVMKELPPGYLGAAIGDEIFMKWQGSAEATVATFVHEGTHNLDPALATYGQPESASKLSMEAEARAFEFEYRKEHHVYSGDPVEKAYFKAYDETYWATRDEATANIAAEKAMLEELKKYPEHYAVETPQQEAERGQRVIDLVGQLLEEMAGGKLWGDEIAHPDDLQTSPGTKAVAPEKTKTDVTKATPGEPTGEHTAVEPGFAQRMALEEQLESARYARARAAADHRVAYEAYQQAATTTGTDLRGLTVRREEALARFAAADAHVKAIQKRIQEGGTAAPGAEAAPAPSVEAPPSPAPPSEPGGPAAPESGGRPGAAVLIREEAQRLRRRFRADYEGRPGFEQAIQRIERLAKPDPEGAVTLLNELQDALERADRSPGQPELFPLEPEEGAPLREAASPKERTRVERRYPSTVLREHMEQFYGPMPEGDQPHHIVAEKDVRGEIARRILELAGYDVNHGLNGAYLPGSWSEKDPRTRAPREGQLKHGNVHTNDYYIEVTERLIKAYVDGHVEDTLRAIHWELLDNKATLGLKTKETFASWAEANREKLKQFFSDAEIDQLIADATPAPRPAAASAAPAGGSPGG